MNGGLVFLIVLLVLVSTAYFGWYFYARWNATRNGLPAPSMNPVAAFRASSSASASNYPGPAPTGIKGWINDQVYKFKNRNKRTAAGAYEDHAGQARGRGGRLDPDEAWSARVGDEAYYEEQELGLHDTAHTRTYASPNPYASAEPERGRSRTRDPASYDDHLDARNPFGDENAASLRGVSPRPLDHGADTGYHGGATAQMPKAKKTAGVDDTDDSPTESRRSIFREEM